MLSVRNIFNPKGCRETKNKTNRNVFIQLFSSITMNSMNIYFILWIKIQYYV